MFDPVTNGRSRDSTQSSDTFGVVVDAPQLEDLETLMQRPGHDMTLASWSTEDNVQSGRHVDRRAQRFLTFSLTSRMRFCRSSSSASAFVLRCRSASSCSSMPLFAPPIHLSTYWTQVGRWPSSDLKTSAWCIMPRRRGWQSTVDSAGSEKSRDHSRDGAALSWMVQVNSSPLRSVAFGGPTRLTSSAMNSLRRSSRSW